MWKIVNSVIEDLLHQARNHAPPTLLDSSDETIFGGASTARSQQLGLSGAGSVPAEGGKAA